MTREMLTTVAGLTAAAGLLIAGAQAAAGGGPAQHSPVLAASLATAYASALAPRMDQSVLSEQCESCGNSGVCSECNGSGFEHNNFGGCDSCRSPASGISSGACEHCEN
jgi:hypothetical protein